MQHFWWVFYAKEIWTSSIFGCFEDFQAPRSSNCFNFVYSKPWDSRVSDNVFWLLSEFFDRFYAEKTQKDQPIFAYSEMISQILSLQSLNETSFFKEAQQNGLVSHIPIFFAVKSYFDVLFCERIWKLSYFKSEKPFFLMALQSGFNVVHTICFFCNNIFCKKKTFLKTIFISTFEEISNFTPFSQMKGLKSSNVCRTHKKRTPAYSTLFVGCIGKVFHEVLLEKKIWKTNRVLWWNLAKIKILAWYQMAEIPRARSSCFSKKFLP